MGMSNYLENELRKHIFRTGSFAKPTALYISLHTGNPNDDASGPEVFGGSYSRVALNPSDANWSAPDTVGGVTDNLVDIVFPAPTAGWGLLTHFAIWSAISGGNMLCHGVLSTPKQVNTGDLAPKFAIGALDIVFD